MLIIDDQYVPATVQCSAMATDTHWPFKQHRCKHDASMTSEKAITFVDIDKSTGDLLVWGKCGIHVSATIAEEVRNIIRVSSKARIL